MFKQLSNIAQELLTVYQRKIKTHLHHHNVLQGDVNNQTFVATNGALLTVLNIHGLKTITSEGTYAEMVLQRLATASAAAFQKEGHVLQMAYSYMPQLSDKNITDAMQPLYDTCERLGLRLHDMLDDNKRVMIDRQVGAQEENFLLLWTLPSIMSKEEADNEIKARVEEYRGLGVGHSTASNPFAAMRAMLSKHQAFVANFERDLQSANLDYSVLPVADAAREIRKQTDRNNTAHDWSPNLNNSFAYPYTSGENGEGWGLNARPTSLAQQVCRQSALGVAGDNKLIKIGSLFYAPMYMEQPMQKVEYFHQLFGKLISYRNMPFRIIFTIGGNGFSAKQAQRSVSSYLGFASRSNIKFNESVDAMQYYVGEMGGTAVTLQINACTWGETLEEVDQNASQMIQTLESWGTMQISDVTGNPVSGLASASMGFTYDPVGRKSVPPLYHALKLLPLSRPASIWKTGTSLFTSPDGKLLPYQSMSSLQNSWITLIMAISGYGKSVLMNLLHLRFILNPLNEVLPYISIIDIGRSSQGLIRFLQSRVEKEKQGLFKYIRLSNTEDFCINPQGTFAGCRFPLASQKMFLVDLLTAVMMDPINKTIPDGLNNFLGELIDKVYEQFSDCFISFPQATPKNYIRYEIPAVDNALKEIGFNAITSEDIQMMSSTGQLDPSSNIRPTTWWEVTDVLHQHTSGKYKRESRLAQYQAEPTWQDFIGVAQQNAHIQANYGNKLVGNESIISVFQREMTSAIGNYKLLSGSTKFELGDVRVVALDMEEVANGSTDVERKQAAIMALYGLNLLARDFGLNSKVHHAEVPAPSHIHLAEYTNAEHYKRDFIEKIEQVEVAYKRVAVDEAHRFLIIPPFLTRIEQLGREYRKRKTELMLASQLSQDYSENLWEMCTTAFILSPRNTKDIEYLGKTFDVVEPGEISALKNNIVAPGNGRAGTFVSLYRTKVGAGRYAQLLSNNVSAIELWALTTTTDDYRLVVALEDIVKNPEYALKILAKAFPSGSAVNEIADLKRNMDPHKPYDVYQAVAQKIADLFLKAVI